MDHNKAKGVMIGQAEAHHKASQGLTRAVGMFRETLDQCQGNVDLMLHVSWGCAVHV